MREQEVKAQAHTLGHRAHSRRHRRGLSIPMASGWFIIFLFIEHSLDGNKTANKPKHLSHFFTRFVSSYLCWCIKAIIQWKCSAVCHSAPKIICWLFVRGAQKNLRQINMRNNNARIYCAFSNGRWMHFGRCLVHCEQMRFDDEWQPWTCRKQQIFPLLHFPAYVILSKTEWGYLR